MLWISRSTPRSDSGVARAQRHGSEGIREAMSSAAELVSELDELCDNLPADLGEALLLELQRRAAPAVNFWVSNCVFVTPGRGRFHGAAVDCSHAFPVAGSTDRRCAFRNCASSRPS